MYGTIWGGDERVFDNIFSQLEKKYDHIVVHLHTNGGDVFAGNFIIQRLENSKADIQIDVVGTAFSMGAIMLTAAGKRRMVANGFAMIHPPSGGIYGTAADHLSGAKLLQGMEANFIDRLRDITNLSEAKLKDLMKGDHYFNAKEAKKIGLIDEIIPAKTKTKLTDLTDLRPEDVFNSFAAILTDTAAKTTKKEHKKPKLMKQALIEALGLTSVNPESSDTAIIQAVKAHYENKLATIENKLKEEQTAKQKLEAAIKAQQKAKIDALLAPLKGKITKEQEATYRDIAEKAGIGALETVLSNMTARKSIKDFIEKGTSGAVAGRENWDWDKWQNEDPRGLEKMAQQDPEAFLELGKQKFGENFKIN
jgi:ATP-dependent Clp protease protease subunit